MSNLADFSGGSAPPRQIINSHSTSPFMVNNAVTQGFGLKKILSGATTASVLKTVLTVSGRGEISYLAFGSVDTTARVIRGKLTIDGVVVFDSTSATPIVVAGSGACILGSASNAINGIVAFDKVSYVSGFTMEVSSSVATETNGVEAAIAYKIC
jgi:hypothetical protein